MSILNAMSVDVEDYFQVSVFDQHLPRSDWDDLESRVCSNTDRLLSMFDDVGVQATFFVLGWVAERFPTLVRKIASSGHEIASHGYEHRLVYEQTPEAFRADVRRGRDLLQSATGNAVAGYRAPSYSITRSSLWALDVLIDEGFTYDASIFPIRHDRYGIPEAPRHAHRVDRAKGGITEVPGSTVRLGGVNVPIGGGGYFRLLPYQWTRWGIARLNNNEGKPAVFYIHPWELDPGQPRLSTTWFGQLRHYRNLDKTEQRLGALLREFRFATIAEMLETSPCSSEPRGAAVG